MSKFIVSKNLLNKFAHGESNLLTENQFCSRRITENHESPFVLLAIQVWPHDTFSIYKNCSRQRKFAHSKEKLLTKIKFAQSKNLLQKICSSKNLLTEFARSIEKLLMMKNLAGSDGSAQWLNFSHPVNLSTAGAHYSTVAVFIGWNVLEPDHTQSEYRDVQATHVQY